MGESDHEQPVTMSAVPLTGETLENLIQLLQTEHGYCLERNELWDGNEIYNVILHFLLKPERTQQRAWCTSARRIAGVFGEMKDGAAEQRRYQSADRYQAIELRFMTGPERFPSFG